MKKNFGFWRPNHALMSAYFIFKFELRKIANGFLERFLKRMKSHFSNKYCRNILNN